MILNAMEGEPLPVYGEGDNIRDWLFVEDHARAIILVLVRPRAARVSNVGRRAGRNLEVVYGYVTCSTRRSARIPGEPRRSLRFVADRPGHDLRYAIDPSKIRDELRWKAQETLLSGLRRTVLWYLANKAWWQPLRAVAAQRLGLGS